MGITKIDCHYITSSEYIEGSSSFVTLNPVLEPGTVVAAGSSVSTSNIGGKLACRLATQHFTEGVLDVFDSVWEWSEQDRSTLAVNVLERAFKRANSSIYSFGHKLAAGGRLATALIGVVIAKGVVAVARAGGGSAYLIRGGELHPFFEAAQTEGSQRGTKNDGTSSQVGANSQVVVEIASIPIIERDNVLILSNVPNEIELKRLSVISTGLETEENPAESLVKRGFGADRVPNFAFLIKIGPESIYLRDVV